MCFLMSKHILLWDMPISNSLSHTGEEQKHAEHILFETYMGVSTEPPAFQPPREGSGHRRKLPALPVPPSPGCALQPQAGMLPLQILQVTPFRLQPTGEGGRSALECGWRAELHRKEAKKDRLKAAKSCQESLEHHHP